MKKRQSRSARSDKSSRLERTSSTTFKCIARKRLKYSREVLVAIKVVDSKEPRQQHLNASHVSD